MTFIEARFLVTNDKARLPYLDNPILVLDVHRVYEEVTRVVPPGFRTFGYSTETKFECTSVGIVYVEIPNTPYGPRSETRIDADELVELLP